MALQSDNVRYLKQLSKAVYNCSNPRSLEAQNTTKECEWWTSRFDVDDVYLPLHSCGRIEPSNWTLLHVRYEYTIRHEPTMKARKQCR